MKLNKNSDVMQAIFALQNKKEVSNATAHLSGLTYAYISSAGWKKVIDAINKLEDK
jgi:hypothetical protein